MNVQRINKTNVFAVTKHLFLVWAMLGLMGCTSNSGTEIHHSQRDNVVKVKDKIKPIIGDEVIIGGNTWMGIVNDYLVINDVRSYDTLYHLFDKNTFKPVGGMGMRGQGPYEITSPSKFFVDKVHNKIHIPDLGKRKIFSYQIDSILQNSDNYLPEIHSPLNNTQYPDRIVYFSDDLCVIRAITRPNNPGEYFKHSLAFWNMKTGELSPFAYLHPEIERKRIDFNASSEYNTIAEVYYHHDLITLYDFKGNFRCNIYGPMWNNKTRNSVSFFSGVMFCQGKIIVSYADGKKRMDEDSYPTQFLVFDLEGNYVKTLDVGYKIIEFCVDEDNERIVLEVNDENIQFAYLDLKGVL